MTVYVEEFLYRGRDPEHERGQESTFHVTLAQFVQGPDGKHQQLRAGPLTPEQAVEKGFGLPRILDEIAQVAILERDAERARAERAEAERDAAKAEWTDMAKLVNDAAKEVKTAQRVAGELAVEKQAVEAREAALIAQLDAAIAKPTGPSNPVLHAITLGLAGK